MASRYLKHAIVLLNGSRQVYATGLTFSETSESTVQRTPGADFLRRSSLRPLATITFETAIPATGATDYRTLLRQGSEVQAQWIGSDGRTHTLSPALVKDCNESPPTEGDHTLSVTIEGVVS